MLLAPSSSPAHYTPGPSFKVLFLHSLDHPLLIYFSLGVPTFCRYALMRFSWRSGMLSGRLHIADLLWRAVRNQRDFERGASVLEIRP